MKKLFLTIGLALGLSVATFEAKAQTYIPSTANTGFSCAATSATNIATVIDVRNQKDVFVQFEFMNDASGAVAYTIPYQRSSDGVNYESTLSVVSFSANGVTKQTFGTNLTTYGCGWIKFPYCTNATGVINGTNIVIKQGIKKLAT